MSLRALRTHFKVHSPYGFYVHGSQAFAFNGYHAKLGHMKSTLPVMESDKFPERIFVYNEQCAPWISPASRATYFERLAAVERTFEEVVWFWEDDTDQRTRENFLKLKKPRAKK